MPHSTNIAIPWYYSSGTLACANVITLSCTFVNQILTPLRRVLLWAGNVSSAWYAVCTHHLSKLVIIFMSNSLYFMFTFMSSEWCSNSYVLNDLNAIFFSNGITQGKKAASKGVDISHHLIGFACYFHGIGSVVKAIFDSYLFMFQTSYCSSNQNFPR